MNSTPDRKTFTMLSATSATSATGRLARQALAEGEAR
jgi:hypothetical protein